MKLVLTVEGELGLGLSLEWYEPRKSLEEVSDSKGKYSLDLGKLLHSIGGGFLGTFLCSSNIVTAGFTT